MDNTTIPCCGVCGSYLTGGVSHYCTKTPVYPPPWQCPCCRAVFGPTVSECMYCNPSAQIFHTYPLIHRCDKGKE